MDIDGNPVVMKNGDQKVYPGDARYEDVNGDGVIDENDIVYLGNSNPTLTGGLNFTLRYKKVSLVAAFHGVPAEGYQPGPYGYGKYAWKE